MFKARKFAATSFVLLFAFLQGCVSLNSASSPDIAYSSTSADAKVLQVPPDLTNISDGEQFIIPGTGGGTVARNSLLPEFSTARYVRQGAQNWLEVQKTPEDVWPRLLQFIRQERYAIERTEPVTGTIVTQWQAVKGASSGGLLKNLKASDDVINRFSFRLERAGSNGTRLFARSQQASADQADALANSVWPADSHDAEQVATLLTQLLVFFGVEEQKARGILSSAQANAIFNDATVQTTASGSQMLLHKGYAPSVQAVSSALTKLNYVVAETNTGLGRIEARAPGSETPVFVFVKPVHISAVSVTVTNSSGERLSAENELSLLNAMQAELA